MTFFFTIVFMLLFFWRPQEWLFPWLFGIPLLQFVTGASLVSLVLDVTEGRARFPKTPAVWLTFGFWLATLMSQIAQTYFQGLLDTFPVSSKLCLFLVLLLVVISSISHLRAVMSVIVMGGMIMSVDCVMQDLTGVGFGGHELYWRMTGAGVWVHQSQFVGIFADPNDTGQFIVCCIPLVFAIPKRLGFVALVCSAAIVWLLGAGLAATLSRGATVGLIASLGCLILLKLPTKWFPSLAVLMLVGGLIVCGLFGGVLLDESAKDRVTFWGQGNQFFKRHLLFGGGFRMFEHISEASRSAHNAYVCCYTELGLFGYWFWFNLITLSMIGCWRTQMAFKRPRTPQQAYLKRVAGLCIATLAGYAVSGYFLSRTYSYPLFFLFGLLCAIPMVAQHYLPEDHPPLINYRKDVLFTGTLCSLGSVVYIYFTIVLLNRFS